MLSSDQGAGNMTSLKSLMGNQCHVSGTGPDILSMCHRGNELWASSFQAQAVISALPSCTCTQTQQVLGWAVATLCPRR